jgi:hypothetical protein
MKMLAGGGQSVANIWNAVAPTWAKLFVPCTRKVGIN